MGKKKDGPPATHVALDELILKALKYSGIDTAKIDYGHLEMIAGLSRNSLNKLFSAKEGFLTPELLRCFENLAYNYVSKPRLTTKHLKALLSENKDLTEAQEFFSESTNGTIEHFASLYLLASPMTQTKRQRGRPKKAAPLPDLDESDGILNY